MKSHNETQADLIAELVRQGIKHTPENIIFIVRNNESKILFLEQGNSKAGLQHIIEVHGADFVNQGIALKEIADFLKAAIQQNKVQGTQGRSRTIFKVNFKNTVYYVAIDISVNGFIVGANPRTTGVS